MATQNQKRDQTTTGPSEEPIPKKVQGLHFIREPTPLVPFTRNCIVSMASMRLFGSWHTGSSYGASITITTVEDFYDVKLTEIDGQAVSIFGVFDDFELHEKTENKMTTNK
ncbi:hypothetical protein GUJ93_ZPchr0009g2473 [Zizania palustris]|uniref:Uncharacterized protein n=1 Tax=Zizania palustris TaxID=103762 RepID=A0A8J5VKT3_ZIZPA|nr:hypothetical protein GUJ93_ZPchr0009g2473 [Zizania palustris]